MARSWRIRWQHIPRRSLLAAALAGLCLTAVGGYLLLRAHQSATRDPFLEKYTAIDSETSLKDAVRLLGQPTDVLHPGGSQGDHIYWWEDGSGRTITVTWDLTGRYRSKEMKTPWYDTKMQEDAPPKWHFHTP